MLEHELLREPGILILKPQGELQADDFAALAREVDPYLEQRGLLSGLMVDAPSFPGWENFAALLAHLRFVRDHFRRIQRIAVVSDSTFLSLAPKLGSLFVSADVRSFSTAERATARAWIEKG